MLIAPDDLWDRAPTLSDLHRAPRGPRRSGDRPTLGASPTLAVASVSLIGTLLAMGAAAATAPTPSPASSSHPLCAGTLVVKAPATAVLGRPVVITTQFHPSPGVKASCLGASSYVYGGLPAGLPVVGGPVNAGVPTAVGAFQAHVSVPAAPGVLPAAFSMTVL